MSITMTIEIPALDRLCAWLESRDKTGLVQAIKDEIVAKLKEAAEGGVLEKAATEKCPTTADAVPLPAAAGRQEKEPAEAKPDTKPVTLDAVQRAAAQMRDDGKLKAVTDMFPEFGIKKLSDLKGDQLQTFGERLRAMGAKI